MKSISLFTVSIFYFLHLFAINKPVRDTIPSNIKNYTQAQFLTEFGKDETSKKIINNYFQKRKNTKNRIFAFSALTLLGTVFSVHLLSGLQTIYTFFSGIFVALFSISFLFGLINALTNRRKYSLQKLYRLMVKYQAGNPLSKKIKRQIEYFSAS